MPSRLVHQQLENAKLNCNLDRGSFDMLVVHPLDDILWTLQGEYEVLGSF